MGTIPQSLNLMDASALNAPEFLARVSSSEQGLTEEEAQERLEILGPNLTQDPKDKSLILDFLLRFKNPLIIQLTVIAAISLFMGDLRSAIVVFGMLFLSVILSYVQETRSNNAVEKLIAMVKTTCLILRNGQELSIPPQNLVCGDLVLLAAGSIIPADLRLISAKDFFVSQAALTGESMPVEKNAFPCDVSGKTILELGNICFQGSNVLSGSAKGVVVVTGAKTYFGEISKKLGEQKVLTSFDRGISDFTWLMIRFMIVMVAVVFFLVGITRGGWLDALMFGLAVAVGLTPEMLPMIVTVNLSKGALMMSSKKVIVKRLNSIQNLGAMDVLCTDKTGTLTQDRIILEKHVDVTNRESEDVLRYAYMNSFYQTGLRNLLDKAILSHSDLDVERSCRKVDEIPFDFVRRRMSVVIDYEGDHVLICKGAVEEIFSVCNRYQVDEAVYPLIDMLKRDLLEEYESLSADGYRVLAVAYRDFSTAKENFSASDEKDLILLGYIAFFDPPKDSAAVAIKALNRAGVAVKVLTGDNSLVTKKVCKDVGLEVSEIITGDILQKMDPQKFKESVLKHSIFARLSPSQKEEIITTLRENGHVVGFLGDGINDASALKSSDVGISVDTASDVAKESAHIVLLEKSLMVLDDGIIEGRKVFGNIIKYIRMGASSNFGNMFSMLGAVYLLPFLPMEPIQILVNNLLYDFSQVGIPFDRVDEDYLRKPRKWDISLIKKFMLYLGPVSSLFDYTTFALMMWFFGCHLFSNPQTPASTKEYLERLFHTGWFVESLITQTLVVHIIRTRHIPFIQSWASPGLFLTTGGIALIAAILPYSPIASYIGLVPLPWSFWPWLLLTLFAYALLAHQVKMRFLNLNPADA
jgi:Mg2+-importing ATPase